MDAGRFNRNCTGVDGEIDEKNEEVGINVRGMGNDATAFEEFQWSYWCGVLSVGGERRTRGWSAELVGRGKVGDEEEGDEGLERNKVWWQGNLAHSKVSR